MLLGALGIADLSRYRRSNDLLRHRDVLQLRQALAKRGSMSNRSQSVCVAIIGVPHKRTGSGKGRIDTTFETAV